MTTRSTAPNCSHTATTGLSSYISTLVITIMLLNFIPPPPHSDTTMLSKVFRGKRRGTVVAVPSSPPTQPEIQRPKRTLPPDLTRWSDFEDPFPSVSVGGYIRFYRARANSVEEPSHIPTPSLCCTPPSSQSNTVVPTAPLFPSCSSAVSSSTKHMEKLAVATDAEVSLETLSPAINRASPTCTSSPTTLPRVNSLRRKRRQLLRTPSIERDFAVSARQLFASHISLSLSTTSSSDPSHSPSSVDSNSSGEESPLTSLSRSSSSSSSSASAKSPTTPASEKPPVTVVVGVDDDPTTLLITPDAVATEMKGDHARLDVDVDVDLFAGRPDTWYTALSDFDDI